MKPFQLDDCPKIPSGFAPPEGYFEQLPDAVLSRVAANEPKLIPLRSRKAWRWMAAAVLVLAFGIPALLHFNTDPNPAPAAIEQYLTYQSGVSQEDIANLLTANDLQALDTELKIDAQSVEDILATDDNFENLMD